MENRKKRTFLLFVIIAVIVSATIELILHVIDLKHRESVRAQIDQYVKMQQYKQESSLSWANNAIIGNINKDKIEYIEFANSWDGLGAKTWLFDGLRCYYKDNKLTVVVGNDLKIKGSMKNAFADLQNLKSVNGFHNLNTSEVEDMSYMFKNCKSLEYLNAKEIEMDNVLNAEGMFYGCEKLAEIDLSNCVLKKANNLNKMFFDCKSIQSLQLPQTEEVVTMISFLENVGQQAKSYTKVDGSLNTPKLKDISMMCKNTSFFDYAFLETIDTKEVISATSLFENSSVETIDLSRWNTTNLVDIEKMFALCQNLLYANLSNWDVKNIENAHHMFYFCSRMKSVTLSWQCSHSIKNMNGMFKDCSSLKTIDISCFRGYIHGDIREFFMNCDELTTVEGLNITADVSDRFFLNSNNIEKK